MAARKIKVLVVDDSAFMRSFITEELSKDPYIEVVAAASSAKEAAELIPLLKPDVMTLDFEMPLMNGIEFLEKLMPQYPLPVVVVSSAKDIVFDALRAGAVDFVDKADIRNSKSVSELVVKIKIASIAKVGQYKSIGSVVKDAPKICAAKQRIIAIGASTGGTEATSNILMSLKNDLCGIVVVQHMPAVFTKLYAERLNNTCAMQVKEAEDGDEVLPGRVLIAPGEYHLQVKASENGYRVRCYKGEKVNGHCPSVDVLFGSVAKAAGSSALGIILTGMGGDGAKGLLEMRTKGAVTIGQNQQTCVVYGMPKVARDIGAVQHELGLTEIADRIYRWYNDRN